MGAIAEAVAAYAQPLLDQTDGSLEQMNIALALGQTCWNLALLPEEERNEALGKMRPAMKMEDDEFEEFRRSVLSPMIWRHQKMFPRMHRPDSMRPAPHMPSTTPMSTEKYPGTKRNAPCPCNSGRKYKLCCGR